MKHLGKFEVEYQKSRLEIDFDTLSIGINNLKDYVIKVGYNNEILYVIDKVCAHAGGKLIVKGNKAVCPMHNWHLDLESLKYNDSHVCKEPIKYTQKESGNLIIDDSQKSLKNPFQPSKKGSVNIRWLNHATVYIECNGKSLITDPWLFGPAFLTGWWLYSPSPSNSMDLLKQADFVYISHNHPDHLHAETLAILDKNKPIITPNFTSASSKKFLKGLGFKNITTPDFLEIMEITENFQFGILKSGDFRDDSGIYICANGHEFVFTVDANFLNSHVLPQKVDLLMTSFAGGASGFPLCYDNFTEEEKNNVIRRNRNSVKSNVINYIKSTSPKYYMPYAGMFSEYAKRDRYINERNVKNSFIEYQKIASQLNVEAIQPESNKSIRFEDGQIQLHSLGSIDYLQKEDTDFYIHNLKQDYPFNSKKILAYLKNSQYNANQIIQIIPTDDNFMNCVGEIIFADFNLEIFKIIRESDLIDKKEGYRVMQLKVRSEVIMCIVENYLPWEDMSIGFQVRASRLPNEYESDFWFHFTNEYIAKENFRYTSYCGACTIIDQNPIWAKPNIHEELTGANNVYKK
uniref:MBL fold metallo-hydrolase n=1 Tax=Algoriphagus sp. TaxID=1872435 RepID=UPI004047BA71